MDEFEQMWRNANKTNGEEEEEEEEEDTPEYLIRNGIARMKILADMLVCYYHAKYGEPLQTTEESPEIKFHLK